MNTRTEEKIYLYYAEKMVTYCIFIFVNTSIMTWFAITFNVDKLGPRDLHFWSIILKDQCNTYMLYVILYIQKYQTNAVLEKKLMWQINIPLWFKFSYRTWKSWCTASSPIFTSPLMGAWWSTVIPLLHAETCSRYCVNVSNSMVVLGAKMQMW